MYLTGQCTPREKKVLLLVPVDLSTKSGDRSGVPKCTGRVVGGVEVVGGGQVTHDNNRGDGLTGKK